jgi:hypothetical protein
MKNSSCAARTDHKRMGMLGKIGSGESAPKSCA